MFSKGLTLAEILIAITLTMVLLLAVTSVDITSRKLFGAASDESKVQDEVKIAMGHIVKYAQKGIGDMTDPSTPVGSAPLTNDTRGFFILDSSGNLVVLGNPGSRIQIKQDTNGDGRYDTGNDNTIEYSYDSGNHKIVYNPDVVAGSNEDLTDDLIAFVSFSQGSALNEVNVTIQARKYPTQAASRDNPEATLTSSVVLRAMSCN